MDCLPLPLRVVALPLRFSCSEVQEPHVLRSYYVSSVISCGPGVLSSFVTLPGLSLWFFRTCLWLRGAPLDIQSAFVCFGIRSSSWLLPRLGALWFSMLSFPGSLSWSGDGMSFAFVMGFVAKTQAPPFLLGLRASLYRPNQRETIAVGDSYVLCGQSGVTWSAWAAHRQRCVWFPFAASCNRKEISKTTVSF